MESHIVLIILSGLVIVSYLLDIFAKKTKIPSVLLLLFVGIGIRETLDYLSIPVFDLLKILPSLGTIGLILIVFEGALELDYKREKNKLIFSSFMAALVILLITVLAVALLIQYYTQLPFQLCLINATPFGVMSSAMAIPSVASLSSEKKEFVIYETSFSDVIGIVLFNFFMTNQVIEAQSFIDLGIETVAILIISAIFCLFLLYLIGKITYHIKFFLIIAILIMVYGVAKIFHLPSLVIILAFGLFLNNAEQIVYKPFRKYFLYPTLQEDLQLMHTFSAESSFILRTFFFVIFGFTMHIRDLMDLEMLKFGGLIMIAIYVIRFVYLKFVARIDLNPILFVTPRGLICILLYFSLPPEMRTPTVSTGLLFMIILATSFVMMYGIMKAKKEKV